MHVTQTQHTIIAIVGLASSVLATILGYQLGYAEPGNRRKIGYLATAAFNFFLSLVFVFTLAGPGNA